MGTLRKINSLEMFMASNGLNKWIVSGNLAADAEMKTIALKNGESATVAAATLYVQKPRNRDESFTVSLTIWEKSAAWRTLPYLKKGSLIICTGKVEPDPYISQNGNVPKAGLKMTVLDIDLDIVKEGSDEEMEEVIVEKSNKQEKVAAIAV
jgi:single-strand DNA-binding protein